MVILLAIGILALMAVSYSLGYYKGVIVECDRSIQDYDEILNGMQRLSDD